MFLKRTSPKLTIGFAACALDFGDKYQFNEEIISHDAIENQVTNCGTSDSLSNQNIFTLHTECNQNALKVYAPPSHHKKRPSIIEDAKTALEKSYKKAKLLAKLFYRKQKVHSQRREAIIRVLQVMLHYMDLETQEVGFYNDLGDFIRLDTAKIAQYANVSLIRANRVIRDIRDAGYLSTIRQYQETDEGRKMGMPAIRKISQSLFRDLKIDHLSLFRAIEWKRKRNEKKLAKKNKARLRALLGSVSNITNKVSHQATSEIRKAAILLEHVAKEIIPIIRRTERQNE